MIPTTTTLATTAKSCRFEPCGEKVYRLDLCRGHHWQQEQGKELTVILRHPRGRTCTVDGCDNPHQARGFCSRHYQQWQRANHLGPYARTPPAVTSK